MSLSMNGLKVARIRGQKSRRAMNEAKTLTLVPVHDPMNSAFCAVTAKAGAFHGLLSLKHLYVFDRSSSRHALIPRCRAGYLQSPSKNRRSSWNVHAGHLNLETSK